MGGGLRAGVGKVDQLMPPVQGWMFWNESKWSHKDHTLQCWRQPSVACKDITVELGGKAKKKHPDCAGRYRSIKGTYIRGREVRSKSVTKKIIFQLFQRADGNKPENQDIDVLGESLTTDFRF